MSDQIRPEALDANNTGVASRRKDARPTVEVTAAGPGADSASSGHLSSHHTSGEGLLGARGSAGLGGEPFDMEGLRPSLSPGSPTTAGRFLAERLGQMDGITQPTRHNSSHLTISAERQLEHLPMFEDVPPKEHRNLFKRKLQQCMVIFNFSDPASDLVGKEIKRMALTQLIDYVSSSHELFIDEALYRDVIQMFTKNIFRSIPPPRNPFGEIFDPDDDEPINVDAWPHMSLVYEFFLRFIDAPDFNVSTAKQFIDHQFILTLLELFDSEDPRERDYLKTTLHRIYGKFLTLRAFIRRSINNVFLQFVYETGRFNGVAELLEIFGSIINGFAIPLKEEHKVFLNRVLIPLHKARSLSLFHSQLTYCVVQFLEKDPQLTEEVVLGLLRYWPKVSSTKEILFLLELEDVFDSIEPSEFVKIEVPLFQQLARCISSPHCQVAERALYNWTHEYFCTLVAENCEVILPIIFPSLRDNASHWNRTIHGMIFNASKMLLETNPVLYDQCASNYRKDRERSHEIERARASKWAEIEQTASAHGGEIIVDQCTSAERATRALTTPLRPSLPVPTLDSTAASMPPDPSIPIELLHRTKNSLPSKPAAPSASTSTKAFIKPVAPLDLTKISNATSAISSGPNSGVPSESGSLSDARSTSSPTAAASGTPTTPISPSQGPIAIGSQTGSVVTQTVAATASFSLWPLDRSGTTTTADDFQDQSEGGSSALLSCPPSPDLSG